MAHQFSQVPQARIPRSSFNRSHSLRTAVNVAGLYPIYCDEVLPGDTHSVRATLFGRLATPLKPFFDNVFMETFFFFVPNRLVWENWQRFNGEQDNPDDSTDFTVPRLTSSYSAAELSLADYFGLPTTVLFTGGANALPFRGYNLIYNEWFRDQNLQDSIPVATGDGPDTDVINTYKIRRRGKRHDYFTSALPWPQKGPASVISLGTTAPVVPDPADATITTTHGTLNSAGSGGSPSGNALFSTPLPTAGPVTWTDPGLIADLSSATAITINQLRESFQIQKLLERDARGGTRYTEIIRSHFGVISPDARLQRPEFLGGGTSLVNINPVAQQSATDQAVSPQGNLAAFGTVSGHNNGFTKSFTEHGYVIGLVNFRVDLAYQQGIHRMWSRSGRYDYYWPALAHLGEQAVLNKEIYCQGTEDDDDVFGYQERFAEYRYANSKITGPMRSNYSSSLDVWHLAYDFDALPVLGASFIVEDPPIDRVLAVPGESHFLLDCYFNVRSVRPMPVYGTPGLIDHF